MRHINIRNITKVEMGWPRWEMDSYRDKMYRSAWCGRSRWRAVAGGGGRAGAGEIVSVPGRHGITAGDRDKWNSLGEAFTLRESTLEGN